MGVCQWRTRRCRGFSLLEVVVAMAVLTIGVAVVLRVLAGSGRGTALAGQYYSAVQLAESKMAELSTLPEPGEHLATGSEANGFEWVMEARRFAVDPEDALLRPEWLEDPLASHGLFQLDVKVYWGDLRTREYHLSTLRLRPLP